MRGIEYPAKGELEHQLPENCNPGDLAELFEFVHVSYHFMQRGLIQYIFACPLLLLHSLKNTLLIPFAFSAYKDNLEGYSNHLHYWLLHMQHLLRYFLNTRLILRSLETSLAQRT